MGPAAARSSTATTSSITSRGSDVLRHYLHLEQDTLGMMGISLSGTPTMKYNPRIGEAYAWAHAMGAV